MDVGSGSLADTSATLNSHPPRPLHVKPWLAHGGRPTPSVATDRASRTAGPNSHKPTMIR